MKIMTMGVVLEEYPNCWEQASVELGLSKLHDVEQHWLHLDNKESYQPKFHLLNFMWENATEPLGGERDYDYIIFCDDDTELPPEFVDNYIALVDHFQLAIAQPARTRDSQFDHEITRVPEHPSAVRETNFVEIGPVFSFHKKVFDLLLPFDEGITMWGPDLAWPYLAHQQGWKMGIVDHTPVTHKIRIPDQHPTYDRNKAWEEGFEYWKTLSAEHRDFLHKSGGHRNIRGWRIEE